MPYRDSLCVFAVRLALALLSIYLASVISFAALSCIFASTLEGPALASDIFKLVGASLILPAVVPLAGSTWFLIMLALLLLRPKWLQSLPALLTASLAAGALNFVFPIQEVFEMIVWHTHYEALHLSDWRIYLLGMSIAGMTPLFVETFERRLQRKRIQHSS